MSFLDSVTLPGGGSVGTNIPTAPTQSSQGSFLSGITYGQTPTTPAPAPEAPSLISRAVGAVKSLFSPGSVGAVAKDTITGLPQAAVDTIGGYAKDSYNQVIDFGNHPINSILNAVSGAGKTIDNAIPNFMKGESPQDSNNVTTTQQLLPKGSTPQLSPTQQAMAGWNSVINPQLPQLKLFNQNSLPIVPRTMTPQESSEHIAAMLNTVSDAANLALSPVSAAFGAASQVPGLKQAADVLNVPASLTGMAGAFAGGKAVDGLVATGLLSKENAAILREPIANVSSLAAQIFIGGKIYKALSDASIKSGNLAGLSKSDAQYIADQAMQEYNAANKPPVKIPVQGESVTQKVPIANDYRQNETIQVGPKAPESLPVAAKSPVESGLPQIPGLKYEAAPQVKGGFLESVKSPESPVVETQPKASVSPKGGEITKAASDISDTLVKQGYEALTPDLQSKYTPQSYKEELVKSKDLVANNYEDAVARISGDKPLGKYEGQILFNEVEREATLQGDGETLNKLASSKLGRELSEAGQTMGAHGFNDNPNSAVNRIKEINRAIKEYNGGEKETTAKTTAKTKEFVAETSKVNLPKEELSWDKFLSEIQC